MPAGLLGVDDEGFVTGRNSAARQMLPTLASAGPVPHCGDLFAMPREQLFDRAARGVAEPVELPLWSALRWHALAHCTGEAPTSAAARIRLRELEDAAIRDAVTQQARGNDAQAAKELDIRDRGISQGPSLVSAPLAAPLRE